MNFIRDTYYRIVARLSGAASDEKGQTAIEYALVAVLIAIVLALAFASVNTGVTNAANTVNTQLGVTTPAP